MSREARRRRRRQRIILVAVIVTAVLAVLLHNQVLQDVFSPVVKGAIYYVRTESKAVSLTFDAVWAPAETGRILDILDRYQVRATFFLPGIWIRKNPDLAREILLRGHEIGTHGHTHRRMPELDDSELSREFELMEEALREELNITASLFRPPYGELDQRVQQFAAQRGYATVLWSVDPHDWLNPGVDRIVSRVVKKIHSGAIILLHTSSPQAADALPLIIQSLRLKGYELLPVSGLLELAEN